MSEHAFIDRIDAEIRSAEEALHNGNEGRARVCARRAAGEALAWFLTRFTRPHWKPDAMNRLVSLQSDPFFPAEVQSSAQRLTTRVTELFQYPFTQHPVDDARIIIQFIKETMSHDIA